MYVEHALNTRKGVYILTAIVGVLEITIRIFVASWGRTIFGSYEINNNYQGSKLIAFKIIKIEV